MKPNKRFLKKPKSFWACVRTISQAVGYSKGNEILAPKLEDLIASFVKLNLNVHELEVSGKPSKLAEELLEYFEYRQNTLNTYVQHQLLDASAAKDLFDETKARLSPKRPIPMNKQKGEKRAAAYLTGLVNMIIEAHIGHMKCDYDPRTLTTFTQMGVPVRTLARRVDGAFPSPVNPTAIWEIKEYYYTTTFGSRVADGIYETLLDGMEIEELKESEGIDCEHLLIVDAHFTWWECGKSYLCRIIDMLHMGYCDEVLFGKEVVAELPSIVERWVETELKSSRQKQEPSTG